MDRKYKSFFIYAYVFILLYMINSLITWFFFKMKLSPIIGTAVESLIMVFGLYSAFSLLIKKYYGTNDRKKITVAWLFHFIPFLVLSFLLFFLLIKSVSNPAFAVFIYLNGDILLLFFTYKLAIEKFIERKSG